MSDSIERAAVHPEPVEVRVHAADGSERGTRTFTAGPVAENFPNIALLKEAVRRQQGRLRRGTASTLTRGEVNGSPKKPWRQKGTGRARAGSKKSPIWRGGGIVFGPKPRNYDYGLPRKQRRLAIRHAMLSKLLDGETRILESIGAASPSAASVRKVLSQVGLEGTCLIGLASSTPADARRNVALSCRNLAGVKVLPVSDFDALSLLRSRNLVLTTEAFDEIQARERAVAGGEDR
jgi:large subunit ribosomal protein L4